MIKYIYYYIDKFALLAAAVLIILSCNESGEAPIDPAPVSQMAIGFGGQVSDMETGVETRALDPAGIPTGAKFGVFGYYTGASTWAVKNSTTSPDIMCNQMVEKTAAGTTYSPVKYWSITTTTDKYTFFAYLPWNGPGIAISNTALTDKGIPKINFTVQDTAAKQVDLLAAQVLNRTPGNAEPVELTFKHVTTRIRFAVSFLATTIDSVKITAIRINGVYSSATLELGGTTPVWRSTTGNQSCMVLDKNNPNDDITVAYSATPTPVPAPPCYVLPQSGSSVQPIVIEVEYEVTVSGDPVPYVKTTSYSTSTTNWVMGRSMLYTLNLQLTTIAFQAKVEDWETTTVGGVTMEDEPMF